MALALYRKYRPAKLAEVVGQEHVTDPLATALTAGRINHAYLFSGPRGCGKTSSARILARSLNCVQGPTPDPCGECDSCVALAPEGPGSIDVVELDAASHGGVEDARELRDRAFYAPAESRYRVFIVDEAHMVTTQGFNALLKIVEEPPDHLVFVFATTEPDKVLPTIRSRTHHYPFRLIPPGTMRSLLERICDDEGVTVAPPVYPLVIRAGGGSARDTLSVLDQLLAGAGPEGVTYERAVALLGVTDAALIDDTVDALAAADGAAVYQAVDRLVEAGHDPRRFAADLLQRIRDLMLVQAVPEAASRGLVDGAADELERMTDQSARLGAATLARYGEIVHNGLIEMRGATAPRLLLELLCARMLLPAATTSDAGLLERLERIERRNAIAPDSPVDDGGGRPQFVRASQRGTAEPAAQSPAPSSPAEPRERAAPDTASGRGASDDGPSGSGRTAAGPSAAAPHREQPPEPGPRERRAPEGGGNPSGGASAGDRAGAASPGPATVPTGTASSGPSAAPGASADPATAAPVRTPGQEVSDRLAAAGNAEAATDSSRPTRSSDADAPDVGEADPSTTGGDGSTVAAGSGASASGSEEADAASGGAGSTASAGGAGATAPVDGGTPTGATGRRDLAEPAGHGAGSTTPGNAVGSSDREDPAGQTDRGDRSSPVERGVPGDPTGGEPEAAGSGSESGAATAQPADPASSGGDADRSSAPATGGDAAASSDRDAAPGAAGSTSPAGRDGADIDGADIAARGEGTAGSADRPGSASREDPGGPAREGEPVASTGAGAPRPPRDGAPPDSSPPESARPAPAPSSLDAAAVRRVWSEILSAARQRSRSTEALLVNATVRTVDGDTLVLSIGSPPLARRLSEPRNTDVIADALHAVLGVRWTVRCDQGDGPAAARSANTRQESRPRQAPTRRSTQDSGQGAGQGAGESGDGPRARQESPGRQDITDRSRNGGAQSGRSARPAPDNGEPLPPEPPPDDAPPEADDEESMMAEAAADSANGGARRDPEVAAMELLSNELGARTIDRG